MDRGAAFPLEVPVNELLALVLFAVCAANVVVGVIVMSLAIAQEMRRLPMIPTMNDFKTSSPSEFVSMNGE